MELEPWCLIPTIFVEMYGYAIHLKDNAMTLLHLYVHWFPTESYDFIFPSIFYDVWNVNVCPSRVQLLTLWRKLKLSYQQIQQKLLH
jgi:hypothetical protein